MNTDHLPSPLEPTNHEALVQNALPPQQLGAARAAGPGPEPSPFGEWRRYAFAALRFKWLVVGATLLATAAAIGASLMLEPDYVARAMVWIQVPAHPARDQGPIWSGQLPISTGWTDLLRTNVVLEEVVRERGLYIAPRVSADSDILVGFQAPGQVRAGKYRLEVDQTGHGVTLYDGHDKELDRAGAGEPIGRGLGFVWTPPPDRLRPKREVEFTVTEPYEAARRLGKHLRTSLDVDGNFLRLELAGSDPAEITAVVNAVAQRFVSAAADLKRQNLTELTRILGTQLEQARENLAAAEADLKRFRVSAVTDYAEGTAQITPNLQYPRDPVFAGLVDMKVSREELRRDRTAIERLLARGAGGGADSGVPVDALTMIGAVQRSTELSQALRDLTAKNVELRALRARYTDANAVVRRLADEVGTLERQTIPRLALGLTQEMALREQELDTRVAAASGGLRRIPPLALEEARLTREVTLREQAVTSLGARYEEARLAEVSAIPDVRLVDPAVQPSEPAEGWASILIALGFIGGLGVGVAGAVVLDQSDRRVQYPEQVTGTLGLNILGAVPHLERNSDRSSAPTLEALEALRAIRVNLGHAHGAGPTLVTVTSPGNSDGKSFVASNIALAFADAGYRTLLIDADVRRGVLHRTLKLGRRPGLVDVLSGEGTLTQALQATPYRTLTFLASGTRSQTGPILVSSAALPRLMTELRPHYDAIIVDSPPLAAGVDAIALGAATGTMLFVLRSGVSDRQLAQAKLEVLAHLPIRVLGAVLNDVRGRQYRYYSYYLEGYEARNETNAAASRLMRTPE